MRDIAPPAFLVDIIEVHLAERRVLLEIVVRAVGDALQLAEARRREGPAIFDVRRPLGIMRQLVFGNDVAEQVFLFAADAFPPAHTLGHPELVPHKAVFGRAEEFHLHLLELARAENEVARRDFVAEGLADLRDAERNLHARRIDDVFILKEDALRGLGAQIDLGILVLEHADMGFEHKIERARLGERARILGVRTDHDGALRFGKLGEWYALSEIEGHQLAAAHLLDHLLGLLGQKFRRIVAFQNRHKADGFNVAAFLVGDLDANHMIRTVAQLRLAAIDHQIGKAADMARSVPGARMLDDRAVKADDRKRLAVRAERRTFDHVVPPMIAQVVLKLAA